MTQGIFCFTGNLATNMASGNAITINVNNVTIDLNGYKLGNLAAGVGTEARGIFADQKRNITIRNGTIRGFIRGIDLNGSDATSSGHLIEDVRADGNTRMGIRVVGTGNVIRNNQVVSTGGSTVSSSAFGIAVFGTGARVINNDVTDTAASSGNTHGIFTNPGDNSIIEGNRVSDTSADSGTSRGIWMGSSSNVMVVDNRIATADFGVVYNTSTGEYRDNITVGVTTPYTGGTDIGNNN
ncbi:MAG: NosD domain-containing protein [Planctomycetota bacterium]